MPVGVFHCIALKTIIFVSMTLFKESTHDTNWVFTGQEFLTLRAAAVERIERSDKAKLYSSPKGRQGYTSPLTYSREGDEGLNSVMKDEALLVRHFSRQIQILLSPSDRTLSHEYKYWRVCSTAIVYFQRFYLNNSLAAHDPRIILIGCILLASKTEEARKILEHMKDLSKLNRKCSNEDILAAEISVVQGLNFNTNVYHSQNLCQVLIADMKRAGKSPGNDNHAIFKEWTPAIFSQWNLASERMIQTILISAAVLVHTPLELAFAALYLTERDVKQEHSKSTQNSKSSTNTSESNESKDCSKEGSDSSSSSSSQEKEKDQHQHQHSSSFFAYFSSCFGGSAHVQTHFVNKLQSSSSAMGGILSLLREAQDCVGKYGDMS